MVWKCWYLWQLLSDPDLTLGVVVDLEPGRLWPATPVPPRDDPLSSPPIEVHLGIKVWKKKTTL